MPKTVWCSSDPFLQTVITLYISLHSQVKNAGRTSLNFFSYWNIASVLVLTKKELVFFTVAGTGLGFWIGAGNSVDNTGKF